MLHIATSRPNQEFNAIVAKAWEDPIFAARLSEDPEAFLGVMTNNGDGHRGAKTWSIPTNPVGTMEMDHRAMLSALGSDIELPSLEALMPNTSSLDPMICNPSGYCHPPVSDACSSSCAPHTAMCPDYTTICNPS